MSREDAMLMAAVQEALYTDKKPSGKGWRGEKEVVSWASRAHDMLQKAKAFCEAETQEEREAARVAIMVHRTCRGAVERKKNGRLTHPLAGRFFVAL